MKENTLQYIPKDKYHGNTTHVSSSKLKLLSISPYHYYGITQSDSKVFSFGRCFEDSLVGEINYKLFDDSKICAEIGGKSPRSTTKYKEWKKVFLKDNDKELFNKDDFYLLERSVKIAQRHKVLNAVLKGGLREASIFYQFNDCALKTRPDFIAIVGDSAVIIDVKTAEDGSPSGFRRNVRKFTYTQQAIMQILGLEACGYDVPEYYWGVMCKKTGLFTVYKFEKYQQEKAKEELILLTNKLKKLALCSRQGYDFHADNDNGIMTLDL